ncbi:hypothetical protein CCR75_004820 [Bremia lactucae]|uniref:mRNA export factor GLE1 n=1 Tax=Bremia lactucae TaxID=4779 RepID=A0A976FJA5_BRELC|nr:hypothetical protein CCR75_004820 [Bremia lactucae]
MRFGVDEEIVTTRALEKAPKALLRRESCAINTQRFRAPSSDSLRTSSDEEDSSRSLLSMSYNPRHLTRKSRRELLKQVERACEHKAVIAVTSSKAYKVLCETLQRARQDAEAQLCWNPDNSVWKENTLVSTNTTGKNWQAIRLKERKKLECIETEVRAYQQLLATEKEREKAEQNYEEQVAVDQEEEVRAKVSKWLELIETTWKLRELRAIQARNEAMNKEEVMKVVPSKAEAVERKHKVEEVHEQDQVVQMNAKKHVVEGFERIKRVEALQTRTRAILNDVNPMVKKIRMQIRRQAGVCNQIAAAPSVIKSVVIKIHELFQMAKSFGDAYLMLALDLVALNLSKQVASRDDYKSCFPLAHVIQMTCVQTPAFTDVILGYFHQMCVFTIPWYRVKQPMESIHEYKMAMGFQPAINESVDREKLEHVTEYTRRMTMITAVLAAIYQTIPYDKSVAPKGLNLDHCWTWLARLVNEPPHLLTGALVLTILEVAGFALLRTYKHQFHKLLRLIARDVCPRLSQNAKTGAANAAGQLTLFVNQYVAMKCQLQEPEGRVLHETKLSEADEARTEQRALHHPMYQRGRGRGKRHY